MLTKPYKFLSVCNLLPIVYFLHRTGKTFGLSLRGGGSLSLQDPRDQKHPNEQITVSEMTCHLPTEEIPLLLESSCITVFFLSFWRTLLWPQTRSDAEVSQEAHFLLPRQGTQRSRPVFPRKCPHRGTRYTVGAPQSIM